MAEAAFQDDRQKGDFKSKGPELLVDLAEQCALALKESAGLDKDKADKLAKKLKKGKGFDLEDFRDQLQQMKNMGGLGADVFQIQKLPTPQAVVNSLNQ